MKDGNTIRAGIFLMIALTILIIGSLWVAGFHLTGERTDYLVLMKNAAGVRQGDRVRVAGMEAGRVRRVRLRPGEEWPIEFLVGLDQKIPITEAASARLTSDGLLGTPYLEIEPGPSGGAPLPAGSTIYGSAAAGASEAIAGLSELGDRAGVALDEVTVLVQSLSERVGPLLQRLEMLLSDENQDAISDSLVAMRDLMQDTGPRLSELMSRLDGLVAELRTGVEGIPDLTGEAQGLVVDLRTALGHEGERLSSILDSASAGMSAVEMNRGELEAMVRDLRVATANLRAFTETIRERPSSLVRKSGPPDRKPGEGTEE